jgi:hypothetical protein
MPRKFWHSDPENVLRLWRIEQAKMEARFHRHKGLRGRERNSNGRIPFSNLPVELRATALAKYIALQVKHKDKIAKLNGMAKGRYLGCLAANASAHAQKKGKWLGNPDTAAHGKIMDNSIMWRKTLMCRLGLKISETERHRLWKLTHRKPEAILQQINDNHGQPVAEQGQTNMDGI